MPTEISTSNAINEKSSVAVTIKFRDRDNQPITPTSATWILTDISGTVVNNRSGEAISSLATQVEIMLSGDDLEIQSGETGDAVYRVFTIQATYNSDLGNGKKLTDYLQFPLRNLVAIS